MAEALFRKATKGQKEYAVKSAGVSASDGSPCSAETGRLCNGLGAPLEGFKSHSVSKKLLEEATHVFTMTSAHLMMLEQRFPEFSDKYYLTCEFVDLPGVGVGADVPDPIGMGSSAYQDVAGVLQLAIPTIVKFIDQTSGKS